MTRQPVDSSNVKSVGYDEPTLTMHVEFSGGSLYEFKGVRPEHHADFIGAPSIGQHFTKQIRGKYESTRLDVEAPK